MSLDDYCSEVTDPFDSLDEIYSQSSWQNPPSALTPTVDAEALPHRHRLNAKAKVFMPEPPAAEDTFNDQSKYRFTEVIKHAQSILQQSGHVAHIDVCDDVGGWFITIQPRVADDKGQTEQVIALAQEALLEAASSSKRVYVMGYCGPKPFIAQPLGFQATLGIMESTRSACYHVFKKGFCRHGAACSKQHPSFQVPVHVLVESVQFDSCGRLAAAFKQDVADVAMALTAVLAGSRYTDNVEAFKNTESQGWTVEVTPKEELKTHKDHLLTVAKTTLFCATSHANHSFATNRTNRTSAVHLMGYASKPFIPRSQGFSTVIGASKDESRTCWDFHSKGICTRGCQCKWNHPECLMPIDVVLKERSSLKCSAAVLEYLVDSGLMAARLVDSAVDSVFDSGVDHLVDSGCLSDGELESLVDSRVEYLVDSGFLSDGEVEALGDSGFSGR
jgi:hypothetical protein